MNELVLYPRPWQRRQLECQAFTADGKWRAGGQGMQTRGLELSWRLSSRAAVKRDRRLQCAARADACTACLASSTAGSSLVDRVLPAPLETMAQPCTRPEICRTGEASKKS